MDAAAELLLTAIAAALSLPSAVFFVECLLGSLSRSDRGALDPADATSRPRVGVLVPAHDEASVVEATLGGVLQQLQQGDRLLLVADNCSDDTAVIGRRAGAEVVERSDAVHRGKGYALSFGLEHYAADPPEVVIVVDADCQLGESAITRLALDAARFDRPIQADYLMGIPEGADPLASISALAFLVKNRVRPLGLHLVGLPCHLTGTGMAFPWQVMRAAPRTDDNLVEDMVMGLDLALLGHPPRLCPAAKVHSMLPAGRDAANAQRRRWEHGSMGTARDKLPALLGQGLGRLRPDLISLALDLMVPPLALLCALLFGLSLASGAAALWLGAGLPLGMALASLSLVALGVLMGWAAHGRRLVPLSHLVRAPLYVLWKLPLYLTFFARGRHGNWERTERSERAAGNSDTP